MQEGRPARVHIELNLRRGHLVLMLASLLLAAVSLSLDSESLTLTTSYPAPSGVYQNMVVTGQTTLGRDTGNVILMTPTNTAGNVGVGTNTPQTPAPNGSNTANLTANDVYLQSTGQWVSKQAALPNMQVFTANGTFIVPAGITRIMVEAWGGGGGGGSGWQQGGGTNWPPNNTGFTGSPVVGGGGGGGGGSYSRGILSVTPAASYSVTVGWGGAQAGCLGCSGSSGGSSKLKDSGGTTLLTAGGGGGGGHATGTSVGAMGLGGSASGGQLNLAGSSGGDSGWDYYGNNYAMGGSGGSAPFGGHGGVADWGGAGIPGGGGSGETVYCCMQLTAYGYGTPGAPGLVVIWY